MVESDGMDGIGYGDDSESSKNRSEVAMDAKTNETGQERWLERRPRRPPKDLKGIAKKEVIIDRIDKNGVNQKLLIFAENQCVMSENNRSEPEISREFLENSAKTWFLWENRAKKLENIDFVFENANFVSGSWKLAPAEREAVSMRDVANESIDRVTIRREELEEGFAGGKTVRESEFCSDISQVHREVAEEGLYLSSVLSVCLATSTESFYAFEKIEKDKKEKLVFSVELFESFAEEQVSNSSELVGRGKMPVFSVFVSLPCQIIDRKCHKKENGAKIAKNEPNMGNLKRKMQFSMKRPPAIVIRGGAKIAKSEIEKADRIVLVETRGENVVVCQVSIPATRYRCYYKNCFGTSAGGAGAADLQHLTRHLSSVHQKKVEWTYKCSICGEEAAGKSTKATRWVSSHMLEKHGAQHRPRIRSAPTTNQKVSDVLKKAAPSLQRPERAVRKGYTAPPVEETTPEKILRVEAMEKMPQTRAVTKSLSVLKESVKKSVKKTEEKQMGKKVFSIFSKNGETSSPASRRLSVAPVRTNSLGSVVDLSNLQGPERVKAAKLNAQISARMETKRRRSSLSVLKPQKVSGKSGKEETNRISEIIPEDSVVSRENDWNESGVLNLTLKTSKRSPPKPSRGGARISSKKGKYGKKKQETKKAQPPKGEATKKAQPKGEPAKLIEQVRTWFDKQMKSYQEQGSNIQTLTWIADSLIAAIFKANNGNKYLVDKITARCPPPLLNEGEMATQTSRRTEAVKPKDRFVKESNEPLRFQYAKNRAKTFNVIIGKHSARCEIDINVVENHFRQTLKAQPVTEEALNTVCSGIKKANVDPSIEGPISPGEVKAILAKIKDTSPGTDGVKYSDLKWFDPEGERLAFLFDECRQHGKIPSHWKEAETVLLPKDCTEEERKKPENWRPISLMATVYKLYSSVWNRRISSVKGVISDCQRGFQAIDGCNESIGILRMCIDTATVLNRNLSCSWLDLTNAFGSVPHELIRRSLAAFGYPESVINIISDMYNGSSMRVKTAEQKTQNIMIEAGVKQGDPISPTLFNICLEGIIRRHQTRKTGYNCVGNDVRCLAFADDLAILTNNQDEMQKVLNQLDKDCRSVALIFKPKKCASLTIKKGSVDQYARIKIHGMPIRTMSDGDTYKYLGVQTGNGGRASESESLTQIAAELQMVHDTDLAPNQKLDVLKAFILPRLQHMYRNATPKLRELKEFENTVMK
ncbi:hypothetical protein CRE_17642, partial [Caenorhabditis remanei]